MKNIGTIVLVAIAALANFARAGALDDAWLKGTTDKSPISYKSGETMVFTIEPQKIAVIPTGIAVGLESPEYVALIYARSGLAIKHGIAPANCVGVVDSDYRGEVCVGLVNQTDEPFTVQPQDRIAQMVIAPVELPRIEVVDELGGTERGAGGFGSTGM